MKKITEEEKKIEMRKKFGPYFLLFYVVAIFIFFIFPKKLVGNIYIIVLYLIGCLIFLYILYNYKKKNK
jgi:Ca2+/Na+ antiporter